MASFDTVDEGEIKAAFSEDGYVILKDFFHQDVVDGVQQELEVLVERDAQNLLASEKINDLHSGEPFDTRIASLYEGLMNIAPTAYRPELHGQLMFDLFFHPELLDVIQLFLGNEVRLYPNYTSRPKLPNWEGTLVLWHQDGGYTAQAADGVEELRMVNVWAPLVPATVENGCMQFIPGTHRLGIVEHEKRQFYLEIAQDELDIRLDQAVDIVTNPGDVVLFHNLMFHSGLPNTTRKVRWSMDWRYQDATQSTMRPQVGHLARSLEHPEEVVTSRQDWASRVFE
jgi:ectoine hydroxylase-related dioxygenase (phytanoyl-CoA dioxygenase family)